MRTSTIAGCIASLSGIATAVAAGLDRRQDAASTCVEDVNYNIISHYLTDYNPCTSGTRTLTSSGMETTTVDSGITTVFTTLTVFPTLVVTSLPNDETVDATELASTTVFSTEQVTVDVTETVLATTSQFESTNTLSLTSTDIETFSDITTTTESESTTATSTIFSTAVSTIIETFSTTGVVTETITVTGTSVETLTGTETSTSSSTIMNVNKRQATATSTIPPHLAAVSPDAFSSACSCLSEFGATVTSTVLTTVSSTQTSTVTTESPITSTSVGPVATVFRTTTITFSSTLGQTDLATRTGLTTNLDVFTIPGVEIVTSVSLATSTTTIGALSTTTVTTTVIATETSVLESSVTSTTTFSTSSVETTTTSTETTETATTTTATTTTGFSCSTETPVIQESWEENSGQLAPWVTDTSNPSDTASAIVNAGQRTGSYAFQADINVAANSVTVSRTFEVCPSSTFDGSLYVNHPAGVDCLTTVTVAGQEVVLNGTPSRGAYGQLTFAFLSSEQGGIIDIAIQFACQTTTGSFLLDDISIELNA